MTLPNLESEKEIALDIETYDPEIKALGPGPRRTGYILGVGIATRSAKWYFSLRHQDSENLDEPKFFQWVAEAIKGKTVYGANLLYDFDFLQYRGVGTPARVHDVLLAEPLIDEARRRYSLNDCGDRYLRQGKKTDEIKEFCERNGLKGDPRQYLYQMRSDLVGRYCMEDAAMCFPIFDKQAEILREEKLEAVYDLEQRLFPLLLQMRRVGVRIDERAIREAQSSTSENIERMQYDIAMKYGRDINVFSPTDIAETFRSLGINDIPYTEKGHPSFDSDFLKNHPHPLAAEILEIRKLRKLDNTFLSGMEKHIVKGRVHPLFNQLRSDDGGTVSGRFSSSTPNCQQITNDPATRGLFIPEENCDWMKLDYRQEEMVIFTHYAAILARRSRIPKMKEAAEALVKMYTQDENADIYNIIAGITKEKPVSEVTKEERKLFKTISLGVLYGMTTDKFGRSLGMITKEKPDTSVIMRYWEEVYAKRDPYEVIDSQHMPYIDEYKAAHAYLKKIHDAFPLLKYVSKECQDEAERKNYVKTLMGRRRRFFKDYYKSFNAVDQGTGGDIMKKAMVDSYEKGLFEVLAPHLTVHDEMDVSVPRTPEGEEAAKELQHTFETCVKLEVPLRVDVKRGNSWAV